MPFNVSLTNNFNITHRLATNSDVLLYRSAESGEKPLANVNYLAAETVHTTPGPTQR